ncbi:MAG: Hsp33 family molecular chaperone HslO, partial [Smithellaceae bacterium]|nr:Hsp33 family molecular chaperone HslO [Smithellaceae bacterium]
MDKLIRVLSPRTGILGAACVTTNLVEDACHLHGTSPTVSAALGRAITGGVLMASLLKRDQRLALKLEADGPLKKIIVEADQDGTVRGMVGEPTADAPVRADGKLAVASVLGSKGFLTVTKDLGTEKPSTGVVALRTGEIAEDIASYYVESEQIPTATALGVYVGKSGRVEAAGGFIIQTLPLPDEEVLTNVIDRIRALPSVTEMIRNGNDPASILKDIFGNVDYHAIEETTPLWRCSCNRKRIERVLITLGTSDLQALIDERGETTVT